MPGVPSPARLDVGGALCAWGDRGVRCHRAVNAGRVLFWGRTWRSGLGSHSWLGRTTSASLGGKDGSGKGRERQGLKCPPQHQAKLQGSVGVPLSSPLWEAKDVVWGGTYHSTVRDGLDRKRRMGDSPTSQRWKERVTRKTRRRCVRNLPGLNSPL